MHPRRLAAALLCLFTSSLAAARAELPRLFRSPSISATTLVFRYADDVWTAPLAGGAARRLTSTGDIAGAPAVSPDGQTVAFEAHRNGVTDLYTIPAGGGPAKRITWHPTGSYLAGWTPDSRDLLVASFADSFRTYFRLFRVHADGSGLPEALPLPSAEAGSFSPDGASLAYSPWLQWQADSWKRYRGGQTEPVWIINLQTLDRVKIPRENSNDTSPVWLGNAVYFLSDRSGPVTLFRYDLRTREVKQLVENHGLDFKTLAGQGHTLAYEQFGTIHLYDTETGKEHAVAIAPEGELPALSPHREKISPDAIQNAGLSPTGARALFEAHGEIFTVPAEKGDTRNLTGTSDAAEREPAWSPDGNRVAYFSDQSGEYKLYLRDQGALKPPQVIDLGPDATYYYAPQWSPDSKRIMYADKRLNLWYVNVDPALGPPKPVRVDMGLFEGFSQASFSASFSPDSKWILYARALPNLLGAAFLYSLDTGKSTQITDGMSNVTNPVWDLGGKYIFFTASTNIGPAIDGFGLGSFNRTTTASVYVAVLSKDEPSPIPPESDEEKSKDEAKKPDEHKDEPKKDDGKPAPPTPVKIDLDGLAQRTLALPVPARNYVTLQRGKTGILLLGEGPAAANPSEGGPPVLRSVWRFTLEGRKTEEVLHNVMGLVASADGEKVLYNRGPAFAIAAVSDLNPGAADGMPGKTLRMDGMEAEVDPRAEWRQMYRETWRIEREFFYDPGFHGLDLAKIAAKYEPYLAGLSARSDLTYLQQEMLGEFTVGHMFISGPDRGGNDAPKTGLLGADYRIEADRYRIAHIVAGGNWNPGLASPLTQPGVNVREGEYLLAVNGRPLHAADNLYAAFDGLAGRQTTLSVGPNPDGTGSRDVLVVPTASEREMREQQWVEASLGKVTAMSGGQVAYVYLPNTAGEGLNNFVRYFYAQVDRKAAVIDDRWNQGGDVADYVIDVLKRTPMINYESRQGRHVTEPTGAIFGPKAMLVNQNAGSGGDLMPWLFRQAGLGPLLGTRTWGGLVGIGGYPALLDGSSVTAPRTGLYGLTGKFDIENIGVAPDVEVEDDPKLVAQGHDPQLERAVALVLEALKQHPPQAFPTPPYPNYHKRDGLGR